jgi:DNA-binding FrmR family transcriptional regulator
MILPDDVHTDLQKRLRRVEGQIRGIQQMLDESRECRDIIAQVSAASKALDQVGLRILVNGMARCLEDASTAEAEGFDIDEVERLFLKLA